MKKLAIKASSLKREAPKYLYSIRHEQVLVAALLRRGSNRIFPELRTLPNLCVDPIHRCVFEYFILQKHFGKISDVQIAAHVCENTHQTLEKVSGYLRYLYSMSTKEDEKDALHACKLLYKKRQVYDACDKVIKALPISSATQLEGLKYQLIKDMEGVTMEVEATKTWTSFFPKDRGMSFYLHLVGNKVNFAGRLGTHEGNLIVVGGRAGIGKSLYLLNMALLNNERKQVFFTIEMSERSQAHRLNKIGFPRKNDIILSSVKSISNMRAILETKPDTEVVYVDYLQLVKPELDNRQIYSQITITSTAMKQLKEMAQDFNIILILAAQLNREIDKRESGKPILSDLKDSSSIEQDADLVLALSGNGDGSISVSILKNRYGMTAKDCLEIGDNLTMRNKDGLEKE